MTNTLSEQRKAEIVARAEVCSDPKHLAFVSCATVLGRFDVPELLNYIAQLEKKLNEVPD